MERLKTTLLHHPKARILDVGTGVGNFIPLLAETAGDFASILGIDQSENAVAAARRNFPDDPRIRFERMDAAAMTFPDASFDVVALSNTLHHLADPIPVFREMERVLAPNGILLINEMVSDGLDDRQVSHRELHHFAAAVDTLLGIHHEETYSRERIREVLGKVATFAIVDAWDGVFPQGPEPTPEEVEQTAATVDRLLARIRDENVRKTLWDRGEAVKDYVRAHGFAGATQRFTVLVRRP